MSSLKPFIFQSFLIILAVFATEALVSCTQADRPKLGFYAVYYDAEQKPVTKLSKASEMPENVEFYADEKGSGLYAVTPAAIDENCLQNASAGKHPQSNDPIVNFTFTPSCTLKFENFTKDIVGEQMAVVLNGDLVAAPRINTSISGGAGFIEGNFQSMDEARELAESFNTTDKRAVNGGG